MKRRPIASITYGIDNCRDVYYAGLIARTVGSSHDRIDLPNGKWVQEYASFHLELTEGLHSWIHAHGISSLPFARELMDINLTGWDGGTIMGDKDTIEPLQCDPVDETALVAHLFHLYAHKFTWPGISESEAELVYGDSLRSEMHGLAFESLRGEFSKYLGYRRDLRSGYFYLHNHCLRLTINMITFARSHIEARFPFFDYDLFNFLHSVPAEIRGDKRLYKAVIHTGLSNLAHIPYDHDELLPIPHSLKRNTQAMVGKLQRRFNRHIWPLFSDRPTLYADYENYLRSDLYNWAHEILFDERTLELAFSTQPLLSLFGNVISLVSNSGL